MGPIATEVLEGLKKPDGAIPVKPTEPVPTYPGTAPAGSPPPTPQPTYQVANPNSWLGMSPNVARLAQGGFALIVAGAFLFILREQIGSGADARKTGDENAAKTQQALIDTFKEAQKEQAEERKTFTAGIIKSQTDLQMEMRGNTDAIKGLVRAIEKLEARIDGKKELEVANPAPARPSGSG